jgi:tRNA pseudouridine32 synthase/23S rRNA pseudouridine746 synthase
VSGEDFPAETGEIDLPLVRRQSRPGLELMAAARPGEAGAQAALTRWRVLGAAGRTRLALLEPVTGRMHQLRAHLSLTGRPILGDPQYGGAAALAGEPASGLMLHALRLSGPHPEGGRFSLYAAPPPAFVATAARAGLDLASALQSA